MTTTNKKLKAIHDHIMSSTIGQTPATLFKAMMIGQASSYAILKVYKARLDELALLLNVVEEGESMLWTEISPQLGRSTITVSGYKLYDPGTVVEFEGSDVTITAENQMEFGLVMKLVFTYPLFALFLKTEVSPQVIADVLLQRGINEDEEQEASRHLNELLEVDSIEEITSPNIDPYIYSVHESSRTKH